MVIDTALRRQIESAAVYYFLLESLSEVSQSLFEVLSSSWSIGEKQFDLLRIRRPPTRLQNLFVAFECQKRFGSEVLQCVDGFYQAENTYAELLWWVDIDPTHARNGFILPELNPRYGFIDRLRVYRDASDQHGFLLSTRLEHERRAA